MKILKYGDEKLRKICTSVERITPKIRSQILDMFDTMYKEDGIGLSAPQISIDKRIFIIDLRDGVNKYVFINPEIIDHGSAQIETEEGCLSFPNIYTTVKRFKKITIKALDFYGKEFTLATENLLSIAIQHELDHLNGVLLSDRTLELEEVFINKLKLNNLI